MDVGVNGTALLSAPGRDSVGSSRDGLGLDRGPVAGTVGVDRLCPVGRGSWLKRLLVSPSVVPPGVRFFLFIVIRVF